MCAKLGFLNPKSIGKTVSLNDDNTVKTEYIRFVASLFDERHRRYFYASLAVIFGEKVVREITGADIQTIRRGLTELAEDDWRTAPDRVRMPGAGRPPIEEKYLAKGIDIRKIVKDMLDTETYGDPESTKAYTTLSGAKVAKHLLEKHGINISRNCALRIIKDLGYTRQKNRKLLQVGKPHPRRNDQFEFINKMIDIFKELNLPTISVDSKKKELLGNFKANGTKWEEKGNATKVYDHDFEDAKLGKFTPHGIYLLNDNSGRISIGTSHDTAEFAVNNITQWWIEEGKVKFPNADKLLILCDSGGSNNVRATAWKGELQDFADLVGITVYVCHYPAGTSKWNKIEHRLFGPISVDLQGKQFPSLAMAKMLYEAVCTTTTPGLTVSCIVDRSEYELGQKLTKEELAELNIGHHPVHEDDDYMKQQNYIIYPRTLGKNGVSQDDKNNTEQSSVLPIRSLEPEESDKINDGN